MPNMSYCRFENTFNDLRDCYENLDNELSESEHEYRAKLVRKCRDIVEAVERDYEGDEDTMPREEDEDEDEDEE